MSDESPIMQSDPLALMAQAREEGITLWSDEKRKDFAKTFQDRVDAARFILLATANEIAKVGVKRKFISDRHVPDIYGKEHTARDVEYGGINLGHYTPTGGRSREELADIAKRRAEVIIAELPPLLRAVELIDATTAKRIKERDALIEEGQKLVDLFTEVSKEIDLADLDQDMSIGEFRKMVASRQKQRRDIKATLDEIGIRGSKLEDQINRALYEGLPGLSEAVVKVAKSHIDRATAMEQMGRRVNEQVMFGDSEAAMQILSSFEKDEVELSSEIKSQFTEAMDKLRLSKKARKRS